VLELNYPKTDAEGAEFVAAIRDFLVGLGRAK